jgi:hypothetical protein
MDKILLMFLDIIVMAALIGTMYTMRSLTTQIRIIREGKNELQQLLQQLNIHISNAQHSVDSMKKLADDKAKILQKSVDSATSATEELQFIQRAAENVALRLEKLTGQAAGPVKQDQEDQLKAKTQQPRNVSKAEKELADALAARRNQKTGI